MSMPRAWALEKLSEAVRKEIAAIRHGAIEHTTCGEAEMYFDDVADRLQQALEESK